MNVFKFLYIGLSFSIVGVIFAEDSYFCYSNEYAVAVVKDKATDGGYLMRIGNRLLLSKTYEFDCQNLGASDNPHQSSPLINFLCNDGSKRGVVLEVITVSERRDDIRGRLIAEFIENPIDLVCEPGSVQEVMDKYINVEIVD